MIDEPLAQIRKRIFELEQRRKKLLESIESNGRKNP